MGPVTIDGYIQGTLEASAIKALDWGAAIEGGSELTIARAIIQGTREKGFGIREIAAFEALEGRGVRASYEGHEVYVGGPSLLESLKPQVSVSVFDFAENAGEKGQMKTAYSALLANRLSIRHMTIAVEDIEAIVATLKKNGAEGRPGFWGHKGPEYLAWLGQQPLDNYI